ncbi:MAG TPA: alpha/beta hydrolase, partial [Mycobacterium sp.]|nr:alpha/beta hydrolase [Mycobacterium sp.]
SIRRLWRLWYQIPIALPVIGPRVIRDPKARFARVLIPWVGAGFAPVDEDFDLYVRCIREPGHAIAGSRWYRTFQRREMLPWLRGEFAAAHVEVPVRWLHGLGDPAITPTLLRGYDEHIRDFQLETVEGVGHWIVEQRPDLVLDRVKSFMNL